MEARPLRAAILVAAVVCLAANSSLVAGGRSYPSVRSQHFVVSAPTAELAKEICQAAETYRRDLAIEWLGHELPEWQGLCPIRADVSPQLGAGGATSFVFRGGTPTEWTMSIQGSRERILDSVLPHEVTHTIFATHFGGPLPRWADEGACTIVEHESEKAKQDQLLIRFLTTDHGIPFNQLFAMREYPRDMLPLYSQGYSLARYFVQQGGKRKFVAYVGEGMQTNNWPAATRKFYGFKDLSDLQVTWVEWVRQGSPQLPDNAALASAATVPTTSSAMVAGTQMASLTQQPQARNPEGPRAGWQTVQAQNARIMARADQSQTPPTPTSFAAAAPTPQPPAASSDYSSVSRPVSDGWYAKRRDQAQAAIGSPPAPVAEKPAAPAANSEVKATAQGSDRRVLLEWSRPEDQPYRRAAELTGVALGDTGVLRR